MSLEDVSEPRLTAREQDILKLMAEGYTYQEITDMLVVGSGVVRTMVGRIKKKLQLRRRSELVRWYANHEDDLDP
jgi:DNA-binding CsgD family transcriptional regulator